MISMSMMNYATTKYNNYVQLQGSKESIPGKCHIFKNCRIDSAHMLYFPPPWLV